MRLITPPIRSLATTSLSTAQAIVNIVMHTMDTGIDTAGRRGRSLALPRALRGPRARMIVHTGIQSAQIQAIIVPRTVITLQATTMTTVTTGRVMASLSDTERLFLVTDIDIATPTAIISMAADSVEAGLRTLADGLGTSTTSTKMGSPMPEGRLGISTQVDSPILEGGI
jgi:hypothetical protein